ncbi:hypothetical protein HY745_14805 [Candidatus Desantisbacteria bacterium]|nr:hypothetical protein [Candidatus Desantisbacteria bacterium]
MSRTNRVKSKNNFRQQASKAVVKIKRLKSRFAEHPTGHSSRQLTRCFEPELNKFQTFISQQREG